MSRADDLINPPDPLRDDPTHPKHYQLCFQVGGGTVRMRGIGSTQVNFEVIDVVEALGYQDDAYLATALIYLMRLRRKEQPVVDVKKAVWWLQRWLAAQEDPTT